MVFGIDGYIACVGLLILGVLAGSRRANDLDSRLEVVEAQLEELRSGKIFQSNQGKE